MTDKCGSTDTASGDPCQNPGSEPDGKCWHHTEAGEQRNGGRPPKLDKQREEQICQAIENGKSVTSAARMAGVHPATVYAWVDRGEDQEAGVYADFHERFVRARGYGEDTYFNLVFQIAKDEGDTATLLSMLKQRYPESWGEVDRGEQSGGGIALYNEAPEDIDELIDALTAE